MQTVMIMLWFLPNCFPNSCL